MTANLSVYKLLDNSGFPYSLKIKRLMSYCLTFIEYEN